MGLINTKIDLKEGFDVLKNQLLGPFTKKKLTPAEVRAAHARADFPGGFNFVEIEEGKEKTKEHVQLLGTYMIHAPFEFGGEQRLSKNYYPGQSEPTVHVLGPRESDITVKGRLYDKRFKFDEFFGVAQEFQELIDSIRIRGNLLRINLGDIQRFGFLEKTKFTMKNKADIEYELMFSIIGFNPPKQHLLLNRTNEIPFSINKSLIRAAEGFQNSYTNLPPSMPRSLADQFRELTSEVAGAIKLVTDFVDTVFSTVDDLKSAASRALGLIKYARNKCLDYQRRVAAFPTLGASLNPASKGVASGYLNAKYTFDGLSAVVGLAAILAVLQKQFEGIAKTVPLARHRIVAGDTLQSIAIKFYNDSAKWSLIYDHNHLTTTVLNVGQVLEIPRV